MSRKPFFLLLTIFICLLAIRAVAEETIPFRGIEPGQTTQDQLVSHAQWRKPVLRLAHDQGSWWFYEIADYRSVRVFIAQNHVQIIDVTPANEASPETIAETFKLGRPQSAMLGKYALLDSELYPHETKKYDAGAVVLFVSKTKPIVKFVRFYSPQATPSGDLADKPKPTGDKPKPTGDPPKRIVAQRPPVDFYGVIPGKTTKEELLKNERWGDVVRKIGPEGMFDATAYFGLAVDPSNKAAKLKIDGYELLEFRVGLWPKVVAIVENDIVWAVDATPPPRTEPEQLAKMLGLGRPMTDEELENAVSETPPRVEDNSSFLPGMPKKIESRTQLFGRVGPRVQPSVWAYDNYTEKLAVLFTEEKEGKWYVKLIRLYASVPPRPSSLGVQLKTADVERAKQAGLVPEEAVEIGKVFGGSTAHKAGIEVGDIVTELAGEEIQSVIGLVESIKQLPIGSQHKVKVIRKGEPRELEIVLQRQSLNIAFLLRGFGRLNDHFYDDAIADFSQVIRVAPNDPAAYHQRGVAFRTTRQYDKALADFSKAIQLNPMSTSTYFQRGNMSLDAAKFDQAIADYDAVVRLAPQYAPGYANRGNAWSRKGEYERSLADFNRAIQIDPKSASAYANRGFTWHKKREYDNALADYNRAIELDLNWSVTYMNRAIILNSKKQYDKALADLNQVIRLDPKYALAYANRGLIWHNKRDYDKAIADYTEAIRLNPQDSVSYINRGLSWKNKGDFSKTLADYNEAIRIVPEYALAYNNRGLLWQLQGEFAKALADYNEAIRINPKFAIAYSNRGFIWHKKKEYDKALEGYNQAIELDLNGKTTYMNRAIILNSKKQYDKALADLNQAIRLDPKYAKAYDRRGFTWFKKREFDKALADYSEAIRLDPQQPVPYRNRATLYKQLGQTEKAAADLEKAKELTAPPKKAPPTNVPPPPPPPPAP